MSTRLGASAVASTDERLSFTENVQLPRTPGRNDDADAPEESSYIAQIMAMKEYQLTTLFVDWGHLMSRDEVLAQAIEGQYYR